MLALSDRRKMRMVSAPGSAAPTVRSPREAAFPDDVRFISEVAGTGLDLTASALCTPAFVGITETAETETSIPVHPVNVGGRL
jgi:hypothetical protein